MYNIYFLPYCVVDMHCVTIKKPSFYALDASGCGVPRGTLSTIEWSGYQIIQYMLQRNNSSTQCLFTVRLIALNKNIEL